MVLGKLDSYMEKDETEPLPFTILKNKLKLIKGLNMRSETLKLLEETRGESLLDTGLGSEFLDLTTKAQVKAKINKWACIELQSF